MIENIRKYNGLIILGLVVIAVALVVGLQSSSMRGLGSGQPYVKIAGRTYSDQEYKQLGLGAIEVISQLARSGDFDMYQFIYSLAPQAMYPEAPNEAREEFFINRMLLRQASHDFGVYPSQEQVSERIRKMRAFSSPDQKFNAEAYKNFIDRGLGRMGMTENDFRTLIADMQATEKIREIVGAGLSASRDAVMHQFLLNSQQISGEVAHLEISKFQQEIKPTDDELKAYWEVIQDAFTTEPQRKFTYLLVAPEAVEDTAAEEQDQPESIAEAAMSDEEKAKATKEKEEAKAKREAELAEKRRTKQRELDALVDEFTNTLIDQNGTGFEELATEFKWQLKTTELVTQTTPPADLALKVRSSSRGGLAISELFKITPTSEQLSHISEPVPVGENQWLVARLDEDVPSRTKTFEEAKDQALKQYVREESAKALKQATDEAAASVKAAMAEGKTFEQASKDAGLISYQAFDAITNSYKPAPLTEPTNLFSAVSTVNPGSLADPIIQSDRSFLVFVSSRKIVKDAQQDETIDNQVNIAANQIQMATFTDWIANLSEAANVERLYQAQ